MVSAIHLDRFKPEAVTLVWFAAFALGALTFVVGAAVSLRRGGRLDAELARA